MDKVLESCFQLLSLFYLTIGRNNEAPATYALTSTIKRLLDHLIEADLYSAKDLESMSATLKKLSQSVQAAAKGEQSGPEATTPYLLRLLQKRMELCQTMLTKLEKRLGDISPTLLKTHEKLISILRCISLANTKSKVSSFVLLMSSSRRTLANKYPVLYIRGVKVTERIGSSRRRQKRWSFCSRWSCSLWRG